MKQTIITLLLVAACLTACRVPDDIVPSTQTSVGGGDAGDIAGFFLLNEGNMGSNKCTLDYYDYQSGIYIKNIFAERNPGVVQELGDVGNDLAIYGSKLWAVVNCSNLVEVMDPVETDPNYRLGYVARIDTTTLQVKDTCVVGYQPEEMVIVGNKLYVANSGGYRVPDYDHTVSVIDLDSFKELGKIDVAPNLHRMELDAYGNIWVSSRGDYYDIKPMTFIIDTKYDAVVEQLDLLACSDMTLCGDSLYVYSNAWNNFTQTSDVNYAIVDVKTRQVLTRHFITDGTENWFQNPYGIAVNPNTHEIFVTDARDYITPGKVYCYSPEGRLKWSANTGDIPSRIVFTHTPLL